MRRLIKTPSRPGAGWRQLGKQMTVPDAPDDELLDFLGRHKLSAFAAAVITGWIALFCVRPLLTPEHAQF